MKTNYHTHSTFCDGKASAEEMVLNAIDRHFDILGFSGHSMYPFASVWHIPIKDHTAYTNEIHRLASLYKNKITIYCGFEADYIPGLCCPDISAFKTFTPDYLIGSVHYIGNENGIFEADGSAQSVSDGIKKYFKNNTRNVVSSYFSLEREMIRRGNFQILGHADLIRKQNPALHLFNETESWYIKELKATAKEIAKKEICVEINTGGMARKYLDTPYPSAAFLEILHENKVPIMINSDAHTPDALDFAYDTARSYARKAGYTETVTLETGSFKFYSL